MNKKSFEKAKKNLVDHLDKLESEEQSTKARIVRNIDKVKLNKPTVYGHMWRPRDKEDIEMIRKKMLEWSNLETSTNINDFPLMLDINPYRFKRIDDEDFQESLQTVKFRVASRNRKLVNSRECDKDLYKDELYLLDQDYKEAVDDKIAKRVAGIKQSTGNITIVDHMLEEK